MKCSRNSSEAVEFGPWVEKGPGYRWRTLTFADGDVQDEYDFTCASCGKENPESYMVLKPLWEQHGNGKGLLCPQCFETRLGRPLGLDDLSPALINTKIRERLEKEILMSMFGPRKGYWYVRCVSDPRWNGGGDSPAVGGFEMPEEAKNHIEDKKKQLGIDPPADCEWSYMKD